MSEQEPHSILYFGETREHWWNEDYLALISARTQLGCRQRVLDVGTGFGHFARALLPHLRPGVSLVGLDPEPVSVAEAERRTSRFVKLRGLDAHLDFKVGRAEALPFADAHFDAVVAQTVLIHLADPVVALAEMARVLAPGGLLLLAEPNNMAGNVAQLIVGPELDLDATLRIAAFEMRCELGKAKLGLGFNSLGESLPRLLDPALFAGVRAWQWDRTLVLRPPYASPEAQAEIAERRDFHRQGVFIWPRADAERYYLAGGGTPAAFEADYQFGLAAEGAWLARVDRGEVGSLSAGVNYLVAATRR